MVAEGNKQKREEEKGPKSWGPWQQIAAYGVGTVALIYLLPRIMNSGDEDRRFIQNKLIDSSEKTIEKITQQTNATEVLGDRFEALADKFETVAEEQDELNDILRPLVGELKKATTATTSVAKAVNEQVEQSKQASEQAVADEAERNEQ